MTKQYVVISDESYPIDTSEQIETATAALKEAGLNETPVWNGDIDDPDSYKDSVAKLFA